MRVRHSIAAVALCGAMALIAGCQLLPVASPELTCVDVPQAECERQARTVIDDARRDQPPRRIVSIRITANDGGDVLYDDGTAMSWIP